MFKFTASKHFIFKSGNFTAKRNLSQKQISTALRPFYFLVHPDLLTKYPKERAVNETSLKSLTSYLSTLLDNQQSPLPINATFYLKPRNPKLKSLKMVRIQLKDSTNIRKSILSILQGCDLPTSYVDSIPESKSDTLNVQNQAQTSWYDVAEEEVLFSSRKGKLHATDINQPLITWLAKNVELARTRLSSSEPIRLLIERRKDEICEMLDLDDILWDSDSGWETKHRAGTLASFHNMCEHHFDALNDILRGKVVVFANQMSGTSLDGKIVLYSGEVSYNWQQIIKRVPEDLEQLDQIPLVEKALSQARNSFT